MSLAAEMPALSVTCNPEEGRDDEVQLFGELLSVATHDLRSPLGAIGIFCELLLTSDSPRMDESHVKSVEMIAEAAAKAQRILEDASEVSRIYRGVLTLAREPQDLRDLLEKALAPIRPQAAERGVTFLVNLPEECCEALCDAPRLAEALIRILEEAQACCGRGGHVLISGSPAEPSGSVSLSVRCEGGERPVERSRRESPSSLKGRLANRKPGESRYSLLAARLVIRLMGGDLEYTTGSGFQAALSLPAVHG